MRPRAPRPEPLAAPPRGRVLVLAPHADDEVIGCGGTLALHARAGDPVRVLVAFDGRAGLSEGGEAGIRRAEARAGGAELGPLEYEFWGYPEGHEPSPAELEGAAQRLVRLLERHRPDHVYAPWIGEHHLDHHVLARAALLALERWGAGVRAWGYEVWTPLVAERVVDVTPVWEQKLAALRAHASQLARSDLEHRALGLAAHRSLYLPQGARYGEAFAALGAAEGAGGAGAGGTAA